MYTIKSGNTIITAGREKMGPSEDSYTKQCFIRTPYLFNERPVVTVTVYTPTGLTEKGQPSIGPVDAFPVVAVEQSLATGETIFKVTATNNDIGKNSDAEYQCDFMMMGNLQDEMA